MKLLPIHSFPIASTAFQFSSKIVISRMESITEHGAPPTVPIVDETSLLSMTFEITKDPVPSVTDASLTTESIVSSSIDPDDGDEDDADDTSGVTENKHHPCCMLTPIVSRRLIADFASLRRREMTENRVSNRRAFLKTPKFRVSFFLSLT